MIRNIFSTTIFFLLFLNLSSVLAQQTIFYDDFEGSINWSASNGVWNIGTSNTPNPFNGSKVSGTVLNGDYPKEANSHLTSPWISLPTVPDNERLLVKFWQWFEIGFGAYGNLQITENGTNWTVLSNNFDDAGGGIWTQFMADITEYQGESVQLGFFFNSSIHTTELGWYIDEVEITKETLIINSLENFDGVVGHIHASNGQWQIGEPNSGPNDCFSPPHCAGTVLGGNYSKEANSLLVFPPIKVVPIAGQNSPQISFRHWFDFGFGASGQVKISVNGGAWQSISNVFDDISGEEWSLPYVIQLNDYIDKIIQIGFEINSSIHNTSSGWYIDDIRYEGIQFEESASPELSISPNSLNFNDTPINQTSFKTLTITNTGDTDLEVTNLNVTGTHASNFSINTNPFNLSPNQNKNLTVQFTPTATGNHTATLNINSNGGNESVALNGTGISTSSVINIEVGNIEACLGETILVPIAIDMPSGKEFISTQLSISGYQGHLEFKGVETNNSLVEQADWLVEANEQNGVLEVWASGANSIAQNGNLLWLRFFIPPTTETDFVDISVTNATFDTGNLSFETTFGRITILTPLYGDINQDGEIQAFDAALILQYLAGLIELDSKQLLIADVSLDGTVSALDASLILQFGVGLIPELPYQMLLLNTSGKLTMENQHLQSSEMIEVPIYLENANDIYAFEGKISYNPNHLILKHISFIDSTKFTILRCVEEASNSVFGASLLVHNRNGVFAKLHFIVNENFSADSTVVTIDNWQWNEANKEQNVASATLYQTTSIENKIPQTFAFFPNSPNPFQTNTTFSYELYQNSDVELSIYDLSGQKIQTLVHDFQSIGSHQVSWEGQNEKGINVTNGTYIYRFKAGKEYKTGKTLFMK